MLKFFFYLFIGYILYSWIRLIFSAGASKRAAKAEKQAAKKGSYLQEKRKKMEEELSEYVDYQEVKD